MAVKTTQFVIDKPDAETCVTDITSKVNAEISMSGFDEGSVTVFLPGSTAAVTTIEHEPNLMQDFEHMLERITPSDMEYKHSITWGENNGKSHLRASLFGASFTVPFREKKMILGQWQQLVVMDFDTRMRKRDVVVQVIT